MKVKTFTCPIKIFQTKKELENLDETINSFIKDNQIKQVISVSDCPATDDTGATIGLIRVLVYET